MRTARRLGCAGYCILALGVGACLAPVSRGDAGRHEFASEHMGTRFVLTLICDDAGRAATAARDAFARVAAIERALTDYDPNSEAMRVCKRNDAAPGVPIPLGDDLFRCLEASRRVAELSGGKFDPTVGPLTKLWRLSRRTQDLPDPAVLAAARAKVGTDKYSLDPAARAVTFTVPGVRLDFGGVGKGFAADEVLKLLRDKHKISQAIIAAGGDVTCGDAPPGAAGWVVTVKPLANGRPPRRLLLANASVSTSGDLDQVALIGGVRYSHVLDPTTGLGLTGRRSVTVVARTGTLADSLTKAASVMPPAEALKLVAMIDGVEMSATVRATDDAPEVVTDSPGFARLVVKP